VGFASGVFGLFTMFLPPLYPTLLRTTGAGFSYNVGRLAAALGTVLFGFLAPLGNFRVALLWAGALFGLAACVALSLPDLLPAQDGTPFTGAEGRRADEDGSRPGSRDSFSGP